MGVWKGRCAIFLATADMLPLGLAEVGVVDLEETSRRMG